MVSMCQLQQEREGCTTASATTFSKSVIVSDRYVHLGANGPDICWPWSENQWRILTWDASVTEVTACHTWDLLWVFLCSCVLLITKRARQLTFWHETPAFISSDLWPPSCTDLNPIDYRICGEMQQRLYQVYDVGELKQRLIDVWHRFEQSVIDDAVNEWRKCVNSCERR